MLIKMKCHNSSRGLILFFLMGLLGMYGCTSNSSNERTHYFLKGYDNLEFRDSAGNVVSPSNFINSSRINGFRAYSLPDTSLTLVHERTGNPYSGYIRTYHRDRYNIQGEFEDGKIFRLRFWYPNRVLGMDVNFKNQSLSLWNESGELGVKMNDEETYYFYPGGQQISQINNDTMSSYFDKEGNLDRYTISSDTATIHYSAEGEMRAYYPFIDGVGLHGEVKQWHPNGQLKVSGRYFEGRQVGIWIQYDSLGNEIKRENYGDN